MLINKTFNVFLFLAILSILTAAPASAGTQCDTFKDVGSLCQWADIVQGQKLACKIGLARLKQSDAPTTALQFNLSFNQSQLIFSGLYADGCFESGAPCPLLNSGSAVGDHLHTMNVASKVDGVLSNEVMDWQFSGFSTTMLLLFGFPMPLTEAYYDAAGALVGDPYFIEAHFTVSGAQVNDEIKSCFVKGSDASGDSSVYSFMGLSLAGEKPVSATEDEVDPVSPEEGGVDEDGSGEFTDSELPASDDSGEDISIDESASDEVSSNEEEVTDDMADSGGSFEIAGSGLSSGCSCDLTGKGLPAASTSLIAILSLLAMIALRVQKHGE